MGATLLDLTLNAAERSVYWFNEPGFIKLIEKLWVLIFPASYLHPKVRKLTYWCYCAIKKISNDRFNQLPFMKRLASSELAIRNYSLMQKKNHEENTLALGSINTSVLEVGRVVREIATDQRNFENNTGVMKIWFDKDLMATKCTDKFLEIVNLKDQDKITDKQFINCFEFGDRVKIEQQLDIVKDEKRDNDFEIKIMTGKFVFDTYHAKISPYICIMGEFNGCSMELTKI